MAARREERTYRNSNKRCIRGEATSRLLEDLTKKRIGLRSVEELIIRERLTFKEVKGEKYNSRIKKYEEERSLVGKTMRRKLRENNKLCIKMRRERYLAEEDLRRLLVERSRSYKMILKDVKNNGEKLRKELREKNESMWLKYDVKNIEYDELTDDEMRKYGAAEIFNMVTEMRGDKLRAPEVVKGEDEEVEITDEESMVLALGPKFCVRKDKLSEEEFEVELEECIAKIKWDKMGEDEKLKDEADRAMSSKYLRLFNTLKITSFIDQPC